MFKKSFKNLELNRKFQKQETYFFGRRERSLVPALFGLVCTLGALDLLYELSDHFEGLSWYFVVRVCEW